MSTAMVAASLLDLLVVPLGYLDDHELSLLRLLTEGEFIEALLPPLLYEPGTVFLDSMWDRRRFLANTRRMQSMPNVFTVKVIVESSSWVG